MSQIDLSQIKFPDVMDLRTAALYLGVSEMRIRTLARDEASGLKSTKDGAGKWQFTKKDLEAFKASPKTRKGGGGPRGEGKAWVINVNHADLEKVKAALKQFGIELQQRYNYEAMKKYRIARDAKMKAEAGVVKAAPKPVAPVQK
jgi:hypothetical protein